MASLEVYMRVAVFELDTCIALFWGGLHADLLVYPSENKSNWSAKERKRERGFFSDQHLRTKPEASVNELDCPILMNGV